MMKPMVSLVVFVMLVLTAHAEGSVTNGSMEGQPVDHSDGKGLLVTPPGWTPVNISTDRGDRLSVETSDQPGFGSCLRVRTFGWDAGVYQTIAPLERGKTYLVSARVKRLSGQLAIEAYPHAWGPAVMRLLDNASSGWTRLTVALTPIDGGAHLYLVAAPEAEFLIDEVQIQPAAVRVSTPTLLPFDLSSRWRYEITVAPVRGSAVPATVCVQAVSDTPGARPLSRRECIRLRGAGATSVTLTVPLSTRQGFSVRVTEPDGEIVGGSPMVYAPGSPWVVRFPYKNALFSSLGYRWPIRISLLHCAPGALGRVQAKAVITDGAGRRVRAASGRYRGHALEIPVNGRGLPAGEYRLRVEAFTGADRRVFQAERPLRVVMPGAREVVCAPSGDLLINGQRFFPIGLYWVLADPAGWLPGPARKTAELLDLRQAGFNTLHSYAFEHNDAHDTDDNALGYLDMAQELGFKVMMGLRRDWYQGRDLNAAAIEQRVLRLRHHPALLCWTLWDEPDFDVRNVPRVQAVYDIVNRLDPYHPAMPVFMSGGGGPFREAADINLFDCYPGNGAAHILPGVFAGARAAIPDKPIWYVARAYQQGTSLPSEQEMFQYWQYALEADVKAIFWYSYGGDWTGWDSIRVTPEHYASVKRVVRALADRVETRWGDAQLKLSRSRATGEPVQRRGNRGWPPQP